MKNKHLLTIEFRYKDVPKGDWDSGHKSKTITVGVFDTFDEAIKEGNTALEILESKFPLHRFPQGHYASKERFSKNGGCFGYPKRLVTEMSYLKTPFNFYAKITELKYNDVEETIDQILKSIRDYKEYKIRENE